MDWDKLKAFRVAAQAGRISEASTSLGISQSTLSRQINALELSLSTKLFHRHARGIILTEQGQLLLDAANAMQKNVESASARIRDSKEDAVGELRVTTTVGFGNLWLIPRLPVLFHRHPQLSIDLILEERVLDLQMREADVAIRMKEPSEADLIRRRFMTSKLQLYASKEYIEQFGRPERKSELTDHRLISQHFSTLNSPRNLEFLKDLAASRSSSYMIINNYYGVFQCVKNHVGVGILPDYLAFRTSEIVQVLPEVQSNVLPIYLAYPAELRDSRKLTAFTNFVIEQTKHF